MQDEQVFLSHCLIQSIVPPNHKGGQPSISGWTCDQLTLRMGKPLFHRQKGRTDKTQLSLHHNRNCLYLQKVSWHIKTKLSTRECKLWKIKSEKTLSKDHTGNNFTLCKTFWDHDNLGIVGKSEGKLKLSKTLFLKACYSGICVQLSQEQKLV